LLLRFRPHTFLSLIMNPDRYQRDSDIIYPYFRVDISVRSHINEHSNDWTFNANEEYELINLIISLSYPLDKWLHNHVQYMPSHLLIISIYETDNPMIKLVLVVVLMNTCKIQKNILHFGFDVRASYSSDFNSFWLIAMQLLIALLGMRENLIAIHMYPNRAFYPQMMPIFDARAIQTAPCKCFGVDQI